MKLTMRAAAKKVTLITTAFVLAVSTLTAAVPFVLSKNASAVAGTTVNNVSTFDGLKDALNDATVGYINLAAHVDIIAPEELVLSRSDVRINGNDSTIILDTATSQLSGWKGDYVIQVYNSTNVEINSLRVRGGDAGFLINASQVTLKGNTHVDGHEFGGIEVSRGSAAGLNNAALTLQGALWSETAPFESQAKPSVWVIDGQGTVDSAALYQTLTAASYVAAGKTYYYRNAAYADSTATNVTRHIAYNNVQAAIDAAVSGDEVRLDKDVTLTSMVKVTKPLTIDGNGKNLTAGYSFTVNGVDNAVVTVLANNVTLKNLTTTNISAGQKPHGVVLQDVSSATLKDVTFKNGRAGVIVNGSKATIDGIHTSGNEWYGINVDRANAVLTIKGVNSHTESVAIINDATALATVNDIDNQYVKYNFEGGAKAYYVLGALKQLAPAKDAVVNGASVTNVWSATGGAHHYIYQSYNDANGTSPRWEETFTSTSKTATNVLNGTFYWRVTAVDSYGNKSDSTPLWKLTIDNSAPTAAFVSPTPADQAYVRGTVSIATTLSDSNPLEYNLRVEGFGATSGTSLGLDYKNPFVSGATNSYSWNTATGAKQVSDGTYHLVAAVRDQANQTGSATRIVIVDNTAPANIAATYKGGLRNVTTPESVAGATLGGALTFQVNEDEANPASMYAEINWLNPATNKWEKHAGWGVTITSNSGTLILPATAPSGTYQIKVSSIKDKAGNTAATKTFSFIVDNVTPSVIGAVEYTPQSLTNSDVEAKIILSEEITEITNGWVDDGSHKVFTKTYTANATDTVSFSDAAGNTGSIDVAVNWIDKVAPILSSPITSGSTVRGTAIFSVNDPTAVVRVNGTPTTSTQLSGNGTYTVIATDLAGNVSNTFAVTINNAQTVNLNPINLQTATPLITGSALWVVDPASVGSVAAAIDGTPYAATIDATGNWSLQVSEPLENGLHTLTVNGATFEFTTSVPASLLTPAITSPAAAATVLGDDTTQGSESVEGTSTEKNLAAAVDTDSTDGTVLGMAWYWWLLILAALATLIWWIIAALRNRAAQN